MSPATKQRHKIKCMHVCHVSKHRTTPPRPPDLSPQQDFDQNKLEEEMRKRKERVEKWREEQRKKAIENIGEIKRELEEMKQGKKWSLEDDEGEKRTTLISFFTRRPSFLFFSPPSLKKPWFKTSICLRSSSSCL